MAKQQFLGLMAVYLTFFTAFTKSISMTIFAILWLATGGLKWCKLAWETLPRDVHLLQRGLKLLFRMAYVKWKDMTITQAFRANAEKYPNRVMFVNANTGQEWTFSQVEAFSNRVANYFLAKGFSKGDAVALFMENRPEYVGLWLGLAKIGVIPALINYNLRQTSLLHTVGVADCRALIYGLELEEGKQ
jgi:solute carrier family 27 fatty acid transporter 1/4